MRFNKKVSKITAVCLAFALCASGFFFRNFYKRQINKSFGYYHVWQGDKHYKKHEIQEAIESYKLGIMYNPKHCRARYNLANIYVIYEDYFSALDEYYKALEIKPNYQVARINYAILIANTTYDYDKAIKEYNKAIEIEPSKWIFIPFILDDKKTFDYNKGVAYYNLGLAWRGKSLLLSDEDYNYRTFLYKAKDAYEKAIKYVKNYSTYYNMALTNHLLQDYKNAGKYYCKAIEASPFDYEAHYNLALLLKTIKRDKDSFDELKKAGLILDIKGDNDKTRYIYDILNDTMQRIVLNNDHNYLVEHITEEEALGGELTYVNGKLVIAEELDRAMINNFENCTFSDKKKKGQK